MKNEIQRMTQVNNTAMLGPPRKNLHMPNSLFFWGLPKRVVPFFFIFGQTIIPDECYRFAKLKKFNEMFSRKSTLKVAEHGRIGRTAGLWPIVQSAVRSAAPQLTGLQTSAALLGAL
jgi:hypothetical protein